MKRHSNILLMVVFTILMLNTGCPPCVITGTHGIFVATFDSDITGDPPDPSALYGPPGAALELTGDGIVVEDSDFEGKALKLTRSAECTNLDITFGELEGVDPSDKIFVTIHLKGEIIPEHMIAGTTISVLSLNKANAFVLSLYDKEYHILENGAIVDVEGNYDPRLPHNLLIIIDPDERLYSVCIDGDLFVANKSLINEDFDLGRLLHISMPKTVTEAFQNELVIGHIRVLQ